MDDFKRDTTDLMRSQSVHFRITEFCLKPIDALGYLNQ